VKYVFCSVFMIATVLLPFNLSFLYAVCVLHRDRIDHKKSMVLLVRFKLFFSRWRPERWFWGYVFTMRQQLLVLTLMIAGDDVYSQLVYTSSILLLHCTLLCLLLPWRLLELNVLEIITLLMLIVLINCVGAFADPTSQTNSFETVLTMVIVCTIVVIGCFFIRVACAIWIGRGPNKKFPAYPKTVDPKILQHCLQVFSELRLTEETVAQIVEAFTESDRHAFIQFVHAFQNASVHSVAFPVPAGARIFVPPVGGGEATLTSFASTIQNEVTSSKLESYI